MALLGKCWRGARSMAKRFCRVIKNGFKKVYTRATRRSVYQQRALARARARARINARAAARASANAPVCANASASVPPDSISEGVRIYVKPRPYNVLEKGALKRCIYKIQANDASVTSIKKLVESLVQEMDYKGNPLRLRGLLREMGLHPIVISPHKEYFMDKKRTRSVRTKYLQKITKYRKEGRPIIYTALSSIKLPRVRSLLDHRAVMAYATSETGIIKDATAVFRYNMPIEDWHYMVKYESYEDWIRTNLMPKLPPNSVVVMRSTPWNKTLINKTAMIAWLREHRIPFDYNATKNELRRLININKEKYEQKSIEKILKANNHTVLRLPFFHDDMNPLEIAWMRVQEKVAEEKTRNNINHFVHLTHDKLSMFENDLMTEFYQKAAVIENGYRISEIRAETICNRIASEGSFYSSSSSIDLEAGNVMFYDKTDEQQVQNNAIKKKLENQF